MIRLRSALLLVTLSSSGCFFPYLEQYRPRIDGLVVDAQGRSLADVPIIARTVGWPGRALLHYNTRSDGRGRFRVPRHRQWYFWLPGTEPLGASSFVSACGGGRQFASESVDNRKRRVSVTLHLRSVDDAELERLMSELCGVK